MRVLHTSDWHLGRSLGEWSLADQQRAMTRFVVDTLVAEPHDLLVIAGDVYDRSVPSEEAVRLWTAFLRDLRSRAPTVPLVAIAGNHDSATRLATASSVLEDLALHIRGAAVDVDVPIRFRTAAGESVEVFAIPFLWPGALNEHRDGEEKPLSSQVGALTEAISRIDRARDPDAISLAVSHCLVLGGLASESERTLVGTATSVDSALFARFDFTALGHLHRHQRVGPKVHYSGSPMAYSFSEAGDEKVVLSVEVQRGKAPKVRAIPVPGLRPLAVLRGRLHDLVAEPEYAAFEQHFVRAELVDEVAPAAPMTRLRGRFPYVLESRWLKSESAARIAEPARIRSAALERTSLDDEFRAFEARIGRDLASDEDLLRAFEGIRASIEDGGAG